MPSKNDDLGKKNHSLSHTPWLSNPAWRKNRFRSDSYLAILIIWAVAIVLLIFTFGSPQKLEEFINNFGLLGTPTLILIKETVVVVVLFAIKQTWLLFRYGEATLTLDPFPGAIGGDVGGEILLRIPYHPNITAELELELVQNEVKKEKNYNTTLLKEGGYAQVSSHTDGIKLQFRFPVPAGLPASDISSSQRSHPKYKYTWRVRVSVQVAGETLGHGFVIPVYPTAEHASNITIDTRHYSPFSNDWQGMRKLLTVEGNTENFTLNFPMRGFSTWMAVKLIFGLQLAGVGAVALIRNQEPVTFIIATMLMIPGLYLTGTTLYHHLNSLSVVFDGRIIRSYRRILGITVVSRISAYNGIQAIEHTATRHGHLVYGISAHGIIPLTKHMESAWKAQLVCNYLSKYLESAEGSPTKCQFNEKVE